MRRNAKTWAPVNLDRIQHWIDEGRLVSSPESPITARELLLSGCIHDVHDGIKILGDVRLISNMRPYYPNSSCNKGAHGLKTPIYIISSRASKSAIKAIETSGGKVVCKYYNPLSLRDCIKGRRDRISAAPTRREDISELLQSISVFNHNPFQCGMEGMEIEVIYPPVLLHHWEIFHSLKHGGNTLQRSWVRGKSRSLMSRQKSSTDGARSPGYIDVHPI
jgi:hypothetical protein